MYLRRHAAQRRAVQPLRAHVLHELQVLRGTHEDHDGFQVEAHVLRRTQEVQYLYGDKTGRWTCVSGKRQQG